MAKNKPNPEKARRKAAAERHRNETPAVIVPPVNKSEESDDLMAAAKTPADALSEENPAGSNDPVIDDAPLVGDPVTEEVEQAVSDQAAADATINTQSAPERSPTNEEMATAMQQAANNGEFEPDPWEVAFTEKCIAAKAWLTTAPGKVHDAVIAGWMKLDTAMHNGAEALLRWSYKTNNTFRQRWSQWFPAKASVDYVAESMNYMAEYMNTRFNELEHQIASKNTIDRGRLDSLLAAVKSNQKVRATKLYSSLTGADLMTAKEAVEALA